MTVKSKMQNSKLAPFTIVLFVLMGLGVIIGIVGISMGGLKPVFVDAGGVHIWQSSQINTIDKDLDEFHTVDVAAIGIENIKFVEGDTWHIKSKVHESYGTPSVSVEGDKLHILANNDRHFTVLGMNFGSGLHFGPNWDYYNSELVITYPRDTSFESFTVRTTLGSVIAPNLKTGALNIRTDIGSIMLNGLNSQGASINTNVGTVEIFDAYMMGNSEITSQIGTIRVKSKLPSSQLNYVLNSDIGDTRLDDWANDKHARDSGIGIEGVSQNLPGVDNKLTLRSDVGEVYLEF